MLLLVERCAKTKRVVIFGAGKCGKQLLELLKNNQVHPYAFFSNFPEKDGPEIEGIPVVRIE